MSLVQWNPFREMEDIFNRLQRSGGVPAARGTGEAWAPAVDITESPREYTVKAELPGVKKEEVKINVENGVLTLSGERKTEHEEKDARFHRVERNYGCYSRSFGLPDDVMQEKIAAEYKDGVLLVHLPKADIKKAAPTHVAVQ